MLEHICFVSLYTGIGYPASAGYFYLLEVFMKKKNRNASSKVHDYSKYASKWNGVTIPKGFRFHQYLLGERFSFTYSDIEPDCSGIENAFTKARTAAFSEIDSKYAGIIVPSP